MKTSADDLQQRQPMEWHINADSVQNMVQFTL